jgi:hypothetical protein
MVVEVNYSLKNILAQNVVQAVVLHQATTKPKKRPNLFPPASAAQR